MYRDAVEAAAEDEEERLAKEMAEENRNRRQDEEERLVAVTNAVPSLDEVKEYDDRTEDTFAHHNLSDHEKEEHPDDPTIEDNTQVEQSKFISKQTQKKNYPKFFEINYCTKYFFLNR